MSNYKTFDETSWPWHTICLWLQSLRPLEVICQLYVSLRLPHFRKVTITFQSQKENTIIYASRGQRDNFIMVTFLKMRHSWWHIQLTNVTSEGAAFKMRRRDSHEGLQGSSLWYHVLFLFSCMLVGLADKVFQILISSKAVLLKPFLRHCTTWLCQTT